MNNLAWEFALRVIERYQRKLYEQICESSAELLQRDVVIAEIARLREEAEYDLHNAEQSIHASAQTIVCLHVRVQIYGLRRDFVRSLSSRECKGVRSMSGFRPVVVFARIQVYIALVGAE